MQVHLQHERLAENRPSRRKAILSISSTALSTLQVRHRGRQTAGRCAGVYSSKYYDFGQKKEVMVSAGDDSCWVACIAYRPMQASSGAPRSVKRSHHNVVIRFRGCTKHTRWSCDGL